MNIFCNYPTNSPSVINNHGFASGQMNEREYSFNNSIGGNLREYYPLCQQAGGTLFNYNSHSFELSDSSFYGRGYGSTIPAPEKCCVSPILQFVLHILQDSEGGVCRWSDRSSLGVRICDTRKFTTMYNDLMGTHVSQLWKYLCIFSALMATQNFQFSFTNISRALQAVEKVTLAGFKLWRRISSGEYRFFPDYSGNSLPNIPKNAFPRDIPSLPFPNKKKNIKNLKTYQIGKRTATPQNKTEPTPFCSEFAPSSPYFSPANSESTPLRSEPTPFCADFTPSSPYFPPANSELSPYYSVLSTPHPNVSPSSSSLKPSDPGVVKKSE
uniref:ETS domain-containing protein n=1 Tax=Heterorhabditis bacteriophora TaxID=37862 RepID=A0A1I7XGF4_HETBA